VRADRQCCRGIEPLGSVDLSGAHKGQQHGAEGHFDGKSSKRCTGMSQRNGGFERYLARKTADISSRPIATRRTVDTSHSE
jgi:hypothetical protein